jgi:NADP-dependent 3-hydroxy acid dehydrogenase YdfG
MPLTHPFTVLSGQVAVITGASSGIGQAIALALAQQGANLCLVGRKLETLEQVAEKARNFGSKTYSYQVDITNDDEIQTLKENIQQDLGQVDLLIHSAGVISLGNLETATLSAFDQLYQTNVRAPYFLTQVLLPTLETSKGQIVFINSSVGLKARASVGQYAATKHALKAIADSLRDEINSKGIRVLSVYPGRTASPMQATLHAIEGKDYNPNLFLQPEDVAAVVVNSLSLPRTAEVTDIEIRPQNKPV